MLCVEQQLSSCSASSSPSPSRVYRGLLGIFALHLYSSRRGLERNIWEVDLGTGRTCCVRAIICPLEVYHAIKTRKGCSSALIAMTIQFLLS